MTLTKRQNEIIDAALHLLSEGGVKNLTVKRIADQIGVSEPAIYRHFSGKIQIVLGIIRRFEEGIAPRGTGLEFVWNYFEQRFSQAAAEPALAKVLYAEELFAGEALVREILAKQLLTHRSALLRNLQKARNNGEISADLSAEMLFTLLNGPVRLLIQQWSSSHNAFDITVKGNELISALQRIYTGTANKRG